MMDIVREKEGNIFFFLENVSVDPGLVWTKDKSTDYSRLTSGYAFHNTTLKRDSIFWYNIHHKACKHVNQQSISKDFRSALGEMHTSIKLHMQCREISWILLYFFFTNSPKDDYTNIKYCLNC